MYILPHLSCNSKSTTSTCNFKFPKLVLLRSSIQQVGNLQYRKALLGCHAIKRCHCKSDTVVLKGQCWKTIFTRTYLGNSCHCCFRCHRIESRCLYQNDVFISPLTCCVSCQSKTLYHQKFACGCRNIILCTQTAKLSLIDQPKF